MFRAYQFPAIAAPRPPTPSVAPVAQMHHPLGKTQQPPRRGRPPRVPKQSQYIPPRIPPHQITLAALQARLHPPPLFPTNYNSGTQQQQQQQQQQQPRQPKLLLGPHLSHYSPPRMSTEPMPIYPEPSPWRPSSQLKEIEAKTIVFEGEARWKREAPMRIRELLIDEFDEFFDYEKYEREGGRDCGGYDGDDWDNWEGEDSSGQDSITSKVTSCDSTATECNWSCKRRRIS